MTFTSTSLNLFGLILLTHAVYSAHEHTNLLATSSTTQQTGPSGAPLTPDASLPLDILIELLVAVLTLSIGVVLASAPLKPIQWNKWAGELEKNGGKGPDGLLANPYQMLEKRTGFWDVRGKRQEFASWVREGGK